MEVPFAVSIPTWIGSLCSSVASLFVIVCYAVLPPHKHFRHALIINLLVADFFNSTSNVVSGAAVLAHNGEVIPAGSLCTTSGVINQMTVQTVDFSIIAISIAVLLTVKRGRCMRAPTTLESVGICVCVWLPGIITSSIALGLNFFGPVSGNWCWIRRELLLERYLLTHGWRIAIFFGTIGIYTYIYLHLKRVYGSFDPTSMLGASNAALTDTDTRCDSTTAVRSPSDALSLPDRKHSADVEQCPTASPASSSSTLSPQDAFNASLLSSASLSRRRELKRMLLLNGYPAMYIVLWIPGIVNRVVESTAGESPLWLTALQATTQFVGMANAVTYGYNEGLERQIQERWKEWRGGRREGWSGVEG